MHSFQEYVVKHRFGRVKADLLQRHVQAQKTKSERRVVAKQ